MTITIDLPPIGDMLHNIALTIGYVFMVCFALGLMGVLFGEDRP